MWLARWSTEQLDSCMVVFPTYALVYASLIALSVVVGRCDGQCVRPAATMGYDLTDVVEISLTPGATFDVSGVACSAEDG